MRLRLVLVLACLLAPVISLSALQADGHSPRLLLTPQRLKRLKRERQRQTPRWINFEERVKTVPDSGERGFELSLYYAITGEQARADEALQWAKTHPCELRQIALIRDLLGRPATALESCPNGKVGPLAKMRNQLFSHVGEPTRSQPSGEFLTALRATPLSDAAELYAAAEYVIALRDTQGVDVRQEATQLFNSLPVQFLLSLKPAQVEHPDWMTHITALALVGLDPNSDSSQFLQGWAIEDRQMLHDGPGLAYELLWADPYLPGVGYQNLDPWWYDDENARLLARTDWSPSACAIRISSSGVEAEQCPTGWQSKVLDFGHLQLIPMTAQCLQLPQRPTNVTVLLWKLPPNGRLKAADDAKGTARQADAAGMWRAPSNIVGKVCGVR